MAAVEEGVPGAGALGLALQPLRLARRGRLGRPRPLRDAQGVRRAPREEPRSSDGDARSRRTRLLDGLSLRRTPDPCTLVIFGASGDLAHKKIMPALYALAVRRLLPERYAIVGVARTDGSRRRVPQGHAGRGEAARARPVQPGGLGRARREAPLGHDRLRRRRRRGQAPRRSSTSSTPRTTSAATTCTTSPSRRRRSRRSSTRSASGRRTAAGRASSSRSRSATTSRRRRS